MRRKVLRTAADVLVHSYGKSAEEAVAMAGKAKAKAKASPKPAPAPAPDGLELTEEQQALVDKFVDDYRKDDLISIADDNGIDSSGHKADIAARLVLDGFIPEEPE